LFTALLDANVLVPVFHEFFPDAMMEVVRDQVADTKDPPLSVEYVLDSLTMAGAPGFVKDVRERLEQVRL
jgi:hypothetical protein